MTLFDIPRIFCTFKRMQGNGTSASKSLVSGTFERQAAKEILNEFATKGTTL